RRLAGLRPAEAVLVPGHLHHQRLVGAELAGVDVEPALDDPGGRVGARAHRGPAGRLPAARLALLAGAEVGDVGPDAGGGQVPLQPVGVLELVDLDPDRAVGLLGHGVRGRLRPREEGDGDRGRGRHQGGGAPDGEPPGEAATPVGPVRDFVLEFHQQLLLEIHPDAPLIAKGTFRSVWRARCRRTLAALCRMPRASAASVTVSWSMTTSSSTARSPSGSSVMASSSFLACRSASIRSSSLVTSSVASGRRPPTRSVNWSCLYALRLSAEIVLRATP